MALSKHFYLTTTLPYVNADPHLGHALELVQADIIVRYKKLLGFKTFFNTGTDEHGLKVYRKALEAGEDIKVYTNRHAKKFRELVSALGISSDINFIRTTDPHHVTAAQEFWRRCKNRGDIYKKNYKIKYCVGCELEKTDSELIDNKCPLHPSLSIEIIEEENYFFRWSKYQKPLLELYKKEQTFVIPVSRFNEVRAFVERGLEDFSISRLKSKLPWGIPVPDDEEQVMYVWFDALVSYISAIGWPDDKASFEDWWPVVQMAGKDQVRMQAAMWQAMLLSAGLPPSRQIIIHGFINIGGRKMSKSHGDVIDPFEIISDYGVDALRYFLAREISTFEDSDITIERFKESYNANLANGVGNLVSRIMTMVIDYDVPVSLPTAPASDFLPETYRKHLEAFCIDRAGDEVWAHIKKLDLFIDETKPFKTIKTDLQKAKKDINHLGQELYRIAIMLKPFLPQTADIIIKSFEDRTISPTLFKRRN